MNITKLAAYIRFQLAQLKMQNKHHEFEHLSRHFARLRICENILPATGPVSAGGDQGRDFETYSSYLSTTPLGTSTFLGLAASKKIVFACSLQADIEPKIRADVSTICAGPTTIDDIYYFAEADIPVARRHALQQWAKEKHAVSLEILDGQALAEGLTSPDVFWIAQEFLSVSAEHYPQVQDDDAHYTRFRTRWFDAHATPTNYADFFEVKYALRKATFSKPHKPDLTDWIRIMGGFLATGVPQPLRRRAIYEICVAALRGQNNLDAKADLVKEYFANLDNSESEELQDATTLLSYCSTARLRGHFHIDSGILHEWTKKLVAVVTAALHSASGPGARCALLQTLGRTELLPYRSSPVADTTFGNPIRYWLILTKVVRMAPLFPLEDFADLLTPLTRVVGMDPRFQELTARVDELLSERTSGFVAAEKCRDRAMQYLDANQYIPAIKQFHSARVKWFTAETLKGSVLSMMTLSQCYQHLGLSFAGAYYALGAAFVAFRSNDEAVKRLFPSAIFLAVDSYYAAGATLTYLQLMYDALFAHGWFAKDPGDIEAHDDLQRAFAHCAITRSIVDRLQPELVPVMDKLIEQWPIPDEDKEGIRKLSDTPSNWTRTEAEAEIWQRAQKDLVGRPFSDLGATRRIEWPALGLRWIIEHASTFDDTLIGEEFAATCQIIAADLADTDLCLLPTVVRVFVSLTENTSFQLEDRPDNNVVAINVQFPKGWVASFEHLMELRNHIFATAAAVLRQCSALEDQAFFAAIENAFKGGLVDKTFSVRPYAELYSQFITRTSFNEVDRARFRPLKDAEPFEHPSHEELAALTLPGPGYNHKKSIMFITNRYNNAIKPIRFTLPLLMKDGQFREQIRKLRAKGYKDWFILNMVTSIVVNNRIDQKLGASAAPEKLTKAMEKDMFKEENKGDLPVPPSIFDDERIDIGEKLAFFTVAKTWGLVSKRQTPTFDAFKKLLIERYRILEDDIPHDDYFAGA